MESKGSDASREIRVAIRLRSRDIMNNESQLRERLRAELFKSWFSDVIFELNYSITVTTRKLHSRAETPLLSLISFSTRCKVRLTRSEDKEKPVSRRRKYIDKRYPPAEYCGHFMVQEK